MSTSVPSPTGAHLVGSVPLADAAEVFTVAAGELGSHLRRIPDGETGSRTIWIAWQGDVFAGHPDLEVDPPPEGQYAPLDRFRIRDGVDAGGLRFERLGYADAAIASYQDFERLKRAGAIPARIRFQVSLPTPAAPVTQFVSPAWQALVEPAYEEALLRELDEIVAAIPHDQLAVQWDVAIEMGFWEGVGGLFTPWFEPVRDGVVERLALVAARVPDHVELGFHLCYGDYGHEHFVQPRDAGALAEVANAVSVAVARPIAWIHLPVPRDRDDDAYFAPLAGLALHDETELYLGLVHATDGEAGTRRRIEAARAVVPAFGVATECGFGRRPSEQVRPLLAIHRAVVDAPG
jgi:hypothetical protein